MASNSNLLLLLTLVVSGLPGNSLAAASSDPALSGSVLALSRQCAANVHPLTMGYLVSTESSNNRFAIGINGNYRLPRQPTSYEEAAATVRWLRANGYNFDVGWGQVNSGNFQALGVTGESLFDGCTNLRAAATVLSECYATAVKAVGEGQTALQQALSCYNTGSLSRGFRNGYVGRVVATATRLQVPALLGAGTPPGAKTDTVQNDTSMSSKAEDPRASKAGAPGAFAQVAGGAFASHTPEASPSNQQQEKSDASVSNPSTSVGGDVPQQ